MQGDSKFDIQSGNSVEITNNATLSLSENLQNDGGTFKVDVGGEVDPANFVQNTGSTGIDGSATFNSVNIDGGTLELSGNIRDGHAQWSRGQRDDRSGRQWGGWDCDRYGWFLRNQRGGRNFDDRCRRLACRPV